MNAFEVGAGPGEDDGGVVVEGEGFDGEQAFVAHRLELADDGEEVGFTLARGVTVGVVDVDVGQPGEREIHGLLERDGLQADLLDVEDELDGGVVHAAGDGDAFPGVVHEVGQGGDKGFEAEGDIEAGGFVGGGAELVDEEVGRFVEGGVLGRAALAG